MSVARFIKQLAGVSEAGCGLCEAGACDVLAAMLDGSVPDVGLVFARSS